MAEKTQTFNLSLPTRFLKKVDQVAQEEFRTRSELVRELLRAHIEKREEWKRLLAVTHKIGDELGFKSDQDVFDYIDDYRHRSV